MIHRHTKVNEEKPKKRARPYHPANTTNRTRGNTLFSCLSLARLGPKNAGETNEVFQRARSNRATLFGPAPSENERRQRRRVGAVFREAFFVPVITGRSTFSIQSLVIVFLRSLRF